MVKATWDWVHAGWYRHFRDTFQEEAEWVRGLDNPPSLQILGLTLVPKKLMSVLLCII